MPPSKLKKAIGAVKDTTSISLAKVGSSNSISDLEVAILKATRHEEYPADERHIREILSISTYSRAYVTASVSFIARRLNKTKNWTVALKTLMVVHRILAEGDPAFEQEIFFATRRGTRLLNMSDFRDGSDSNPWDYSAFVRTYALYLDEKLEFKMVGRRGKRSSYGTVDEEHYQEQQEHHTPHAASTPVRDMKIEQLFSRSHHLQQLLDRFLACRATGSAKHNRVVTVALYSIVKESFQIYYDITEILGILIDRFMELHVSDSVKVYEIFCRILKQFDELDNFYGWCKTVGIARSSEYPEIEKITPKKLELMDEFIRDKSALAQRRPLTPPEPEPEPEEQFEQPEPEEEDMNSIKALPPPEETPIEEEQFQPEQEEQQPPPPEPPQQFEGDLLNLAEDSVSSEQHGDQLALALFDGSASTGPPATTVWEAFKEDSADWETALVQSASGLSQQRAALGGGFDTLLLDGMYQQGAMTAAVNNPAFGNTGSASSVALGSAGRPAMLALPAPPTSDNAGGMNMNVDPFAASMVVPPPSYVQMSELEKKQKLLVDEQMMWQQYARDGRQGHVGIDQNYNVGGYAHGY